MEALRCTSSIAVGFHCCLAPLHTVFRMLTQQPGYCVAELTRLKVNKIVSQECRCVSFELFVWSPCVPP